MDNDLFAILLLIGFSLVILIIVIWVFLSERKKDILRKEEEIKAEVYKMEKYNEMVIAKIQELETIARAISLDKISIFLEIKDSDVKYLVKKAIADFDYIIDGDYLTKRDNKKVVQEATKICSLCGKEISKELKYCNYCGTEQK